MPEKVFSWSGDFDIISKCAANACIAKDFKVERNTSHLIIFKNRGYDGEIRIKDQSLHLNISANGGNSASAICFAILFFLFGFGLLNAWYVLSRKPKNYIKHIVKRLFTQLQQYSGTTIYIDASGRPITPATQTDHPSFTSEYLEPTSQIESRDFAQQQTPTEISCNLCDGTGICRTCAGLGEIEGERTCELCEGTGKCMCED